MNLLDIISLTKAGYKKKDIDELLKIQIDESEKSADDQDSMEDQTDSKGESEESPKDDQNDPESKPDFETLYNNLKTELEDVKKQLKSAQKDNIRKNNADSDAGKKPDEDYNDIFRTFM